MNPRAATNDLPAFQASPFNHLGTSPNALHKIDMAERVGFEPTAPFGVTGFQDQLLKPLGHLSIMNVFIDYPSAINFYILHDFILFVNTFFTYFSSFSKFHNSKSWQLNYYTLFLYPCQAFFIQYFEIYFL